MKLKQIFYSWMDDGDPRLNRHFIDGCLKAAIKKLNRAELTDYEVVRDTGGLAGMVDINQVILQRIQESAVFVADVTLINPSSVRRPDERPTPNPNVMFELGYAYSAKGEDSIIAVFNTASGAVTDLPFDIRPKRILTYHAATDEDRPSAKTKLTESLVDALRLCLKDTAERGVARNSLYVDAITEALLLTSEIEDWPHDPTLTSAVEHIRKKLADAVAQSLVKGSTEALLHSALKAFAAAARLAPTEENWEDVKKHIQSADVFVRFLREQLPLRPDDTTVAQWFSVLREAPSKIRTTIEHLEVEISETKSISNQQLESFDEQTWAVRMVALHGPDPAHPKFQDALLSLSRKLRKACLFIRAKNVLAVREIREMCAELDALLLAYHPAPESKQGT